ncbi:hypothetical protein GGR57DRAFT_300845 [Xylariaceae sp. FL1272]|nr:hypothetical protein GGR57DRAFT_300845 [Xylariaceae sp. FL1272]
MSANGKSNMLSDEQILADLQMFHPVQSGSEKNVWAYWDKGLSECPPWCQRNIIGWVRRLGPAWKVRVLDLVEGSPTHVSKYVKPSFFPSVFLNNKMTGSYVGPHSADLVRLPLLYLYGGVWLDVGFMLFRGLDSLCWTTLADPDSPFEMAGFAIQMGPGVGMMFNGFIAARKGCRCIKFWHETFVEVWKGADSTAGMSNHPLLIHLPRYEPPSIGGKMPPFRYAQFADYLAQVLCLERVRHLTDRSLGWTGAEYFEKNVLLYDCPSEVYRAQQLTNWDGRKQFDLLGRQRGGGDKDSAGYLEAESFVSDILATSSTMKISHGLPTPGREYLSDIWDKPENHSADNTPGTFAAYLRLCAETLQQQRTMKPVQLPTLIQALLEGPLLEARGDAREDD